MHCRRRSTTTADHERALQVDVEPVAMCPPDEASRRSGAVGYLREQPPSLSYLAVKRRQLLIGCGQRTLLYFFGALMAKNRIN